jgi:hypothetical protein
MPRYVRQCAARTDINAYVNMSVYGAGNVFRKEFGFDARYSERP